MVEIDTASPPFDQLRSIQRLASARSGHASAEHARHQLYVARDKRSRSNVLVKIASKPGLVYEQELTNEIDSLSTINRDLPDSRYFPVLWEHGRLRDSRIYLIMSLFDEWPLATTISADRTPVSEAAHIRTMIEVGKALMELHGLNIFHVDLNPMNVLGRWVSGKPVIRIVDFESSYEVARHANGVFYNPPTTSAFLAPELPLHAPDARSDLFSLAAVLYTMLAGYDWTWAADVARSVRADPEVAPELKEILLTSVDADPEKRYSSVVEFRAALTAYFERTWPGRLRQRAD
ncbi:MAG TPA: protein kinase [Vicinamibacterales bacterium]